MSPRGATEEEMRRRPGWTCRDLSIISGCSSDTQQLLLLRDERCKQGLERSPCLLRPARLEIFSIAFVERESFLQAARTFRDASIFSNGGSCAIKRTSSASAAISPSETENPNATRGGVFPLSLSVKRDTERSLVELYLVRMRKN